MNEESFVVYEGPATLAKKVVEQLENERLKGWIYSEVKWSSRYEFISKAYRGKLKNKIPKDRVNA